MSEATETTESSKAPDPRYASMAKVAPRKRLSLAPAPATTPTAPRATEPIEPSSATPVPNASTTSTAAAGTTAPSSAAPRTKKSAAKPNRTTSTAPASSTASKLERVPVRLDAELHALLNAKTAETGLSQTGVVLAAIEAAHNAKAFDFQAPGTSLFLGAAGRRRGPATAKVMIDLRPRTEDLATIEKLMGEHQAPDRTAFITAALEHYLR